MDNPPIPNSGDLPAMSKSALKKLAKQQRQEDKKAERKAAEKERRRLDLERRRREWDEKMAAANGEEERQRMIAERRGMRIERMGKRAQEKGMKIERLRKAAEVGVNVVIDLEFSELMKANEMHSLVQQVMYCYAVNGRCPSPAHLWLTGCQGEMETHLQRIPGYNNWMIEKESRSYIEAFQENKHNLVYLTADAETVLEELDPGKTYIIGGLVDRNRWKGITMKKANEQGILSAKLPIGSYLKMSSSQVLTVNQVFEILLKFIETKDWKESFFQVIPQRKRGDEKGEEEQVDDGIDGHDATATVSEEEAKLESIEENGTLHKKQRVEFSDTAETENGVEVEVEENQ